MSTQTELISSLYAGFVDYEGASLEAYRPKLLTNDHEKGQKVLTSIIKELSCCDEFFFSVAFITQSGVQVLLNTLKELEDHQIKGKIVASQYLNFTEPKALERLLEFRNIELRMVVNGNHHAKGYIFRKKDTFSLIVGSSNLTQDALGSNKEWNIKVSSMEKGSLIRDTLLEFEETFKRADQLDSMWIAAYNNIYVESRKARFQGNSLTAEDIETEELFSTPYEPEIPKDEKSVYQVHKLHLNQIMPNKMQVRALVGIEKIREQGEKKALLISATGTGKTYLAAFDVRKVQPKRFLFLVHREQILDQAIQSFKNVLGHDIDTGKLAGSEKMTQAQYLFSTVQMMSKLHVLTGFSKKEFNYIVIDESHRLGAETYQRILDHFTPDFLLGMTATPERTDGYNIFSDFNYNIAYEIRLQEAMKEEMLCPFHYYGITDLYVDGVQIDEVTEFKHLVSEERVEHIIEKIAFYGYHGDRVRGLIFCSQKAEAREISRVFNSKGYKTIALTGDDSQETREEAVRRLEQKERYNRLDYIFTVDIFNEGVDIPKVNQVVMLRPTQSAIIFVQQLGRGLRKINGKAYVVVIDFIGNYQNNFLIPIAISGDRSYNKDTIRHFLTEGNRIIPGCSTVNFDAIAKEKIFKSIDNIKGIRKIIKECYVKFKYRLGHIPSLLEFYKHGEIDPILILSEYKTYVSFLKSVEETYKEIRISDHEFIILEYLSKIIPQGVRPHEIEILKLLVSKDAFSKEEIQVELSKRYGLTTDDINIDAAIAVLKGVFVSNEMEKEKYSSMNLVRDTNTGYYERMDNFYDHIKSNEFLKHLNDLVDLGTKRYKDIYSKKKASGGKFVLYQKYSRRDVCLLLNWGKDLSSIMYGMKRIDDDVAIFVTYHKADSDGDHEYIEGKPDYADEFMTGSNQIFLWDSQIGRGPESSYVRDVCEPTSKHLFVKKSDGEGMDFYYMGLFDVLDVSGDYKKDNKGKMRAITKFKFKLQDPVREELMDYLESN